MLPGERQSLLGKEYKLSYFPVPPPPPRDNTLYSSWKYFDCTFSKMPLWKQHPLHSVNWAATSYDTCMIPASLYDRFTYKVCCLGDSNCCDCSAKDCLYCGACAVALNLPKIPCCVLGSFTACILGAAGAIVDSTNYCVPPRQLMDDPQPLLPLASSNKGYPLAQTPDNFQAKGDEKPSIRDQSKKRRLDTIENISAQIDDWIQKNDLAAVIGFFDDKSKLALLQMPGLYSKKVFLVCLAIRNTNELIDLEKREAFISSILDPDIVNGYNSTQGWITAPLLEASRSKYRHASELLELLCEFKAEVFKPCGSRDDDDATPNYLPLWIYAAFLEKRDPEIYYRALILKHYAGQNPFTVNAFLEKNPDYGSLDTEVKSLTEVGSARRKRRTHLLEAIQPLMPPKAISVLIGQYSGLFPPNRLDSQSESAMVITIPVFAASAAIQEHSQIFTVAESKESKSKKRGLEKYDPFPPLQRLEPARDMEPANNIGFSYGGL